MRIRFERATPEDAARLSEVQTLSFREDYLRYGECPSYQEPEDRMREMIEQALVYKILVDEAIVGDVIVRNRGNGCCYLRTIAVLPSYQNLGIGSKAMAFVEREHGDAVEWILVTPEASERNRHFYEKAGYRQVGKTRHSEVLTLVDYRKGAGAEQ